MTDKAVKDRLRDILFDHWNECLPYDVKAKISSSDVSRILDVTMEWIDDHKDAISLLREPTVLHKSSVFDTDKEPGFLSDLAKV